MNKAPRGGTISVVNGQRYEGGEFMPDHGLYCGRGKNRVTKVAFDSAVESANRAGYELRFNEEHEVFQLVRKFIVYFSAKRLSTLMPVIQ